MGLLEVSLLLGCAALLLVLVPSCLAFVLLRRAKKDADRLQDDRVRR